MSEFIAVIEGDDRFLAADEQRDDHVRIYDDIPQRQDRHAANARLLTLFGHTTLQNPF